MLVFVHTFDEEEEKEPDFDEKKAGEDDAIAVDADDLFDDDLENEDAKFGDNEDDEDEEKVDYDRHDDADRI